MNFTCLYVYLIIILTFLTDENPKADDIPDKHKRLLLNDMDTFKQELLSLQQEVQTLKAKVSQYDSLEQQIHQLQEEKQQSHQGVTVFTSWGRKLCPSVNGTEMIYTDCLRPLTMNKYIHNKARCRRHKNTIIFKCDNNRPGCCRIMASKRYSELGGGTNTLCLPHDPEPTLTDFPTSLFHGYTGRLWGSEYQFNYRQVAVDDDAPCAVCHVNYSTTVLMIPAKRSCPVGWTVQIKGFLISTMTSDHASDFLCMDDNPEYFEGTRQQDLNGRTIYPVRASCGSLPCPPYTKDQFISCVVCSK